MKIKHLFMYLAGKVHRKMYEHVRFYLMRRYWPNTDEPRKINEWLLRKKITSTYSNTKLCGTFEGYEEAKRLSDDVKIPNVHGLIFSNMDFQVLDEMADGDYVAKGSHGSGMIQFFSMKDSLVNIGRSKLERKISRWLDTNYSTISGEVCYEDASKVVIIEQALSSKPAIDIKVHCSHGRPRLVQYIDRSKNMDRYTWDCQEVNSLTPIAMYRNELADEPSISNLILQAVSYTEALCKKFDYVRVDFMVDNEKENIYFSEFTLMPAGGCMPLINESKEVLFFKICRLG